MLIVGVVVIGIGVVLAAANRFLARLFDQNPGPLGPQLSIAELRAVFTYVGCSAAIIGADLLSNAVPGSVVGVLVGAGGVWTFIAVKIVEARRERTKGM